MPLSAEPIRLRTESRVGLSDDYWLMSEAAKEDDRLSGLLVAWKKAKSCAAKRGIIAHFKIMMREIEKCQTQNDSK